MPKIRDRFALDLAILQLCDLEANAKNVLSGAPTDALVAEQARRTRIAVSLARQALLWAQGSDGTPADREASRESLRGAISRMIAEWPGGWPGAHPTCISRWREWEASPKRGGVVYVRMSAASPLLWPVAQVRVEDGGVIWTVQASPTCLADGQLAYTPGHEADALREAMEAADRTLRGWGCDLG